MKSNSRQLQSRLALDQTKDALRHPYTWPGAYPKHIFVENGCVCHDCVRSNFRDVVQDTKAGRGAWEVHAVDVLWEGTVACDECGKQLEVAYESDEAIEC